MKRNLVLVIVGLVSLTVHSLDETIVFGAPSGPPWIGQFAISVLLVALTALHPRLGRWRLAVPAALLVLLGVFVIGTGWIAHVRPLLERGPGPADASGLLFLLGGVLLLASGALLQQRAMTSWRAVARPWSAG